MLNHNFKCPKCKKKYYIVSYSVNSKGEHKFKNKIICCKESKCKNEPLEFINNKEIGLPNFGKFASLSPLEKQKFLKKRSKIDAYKNHNPKDVKGFSIP